MVPPSLPYSPGLLHLWPPQKGMYESPSPATSHHCFRPSLSPQAYWLSNLPYSLPLTPFQGLCSGWGLWNPGLWGFTTELGWERVNSTKDG